ncbi:MAG: UDP-N-acetylmuramoyl-L-alanine--D-glutamate ligase [Propionibacteriaceae bacterium]|nr:UDP-N-acetylmuramoyl-L-alanine--D-glutamate ligase [Propionibacteriaceae bacterium]
MSDWLASANRQSDWSQVQVVVAGIGSSGFSAADTLNHFGAHVIVVDDSVSEAASNKATLLETLGVDVRLGAGATTDLPECDLVIASPGWPPSSPLYRQAHMSQVPIWGDVELAWRLQQPDRSVPWLGVTGTNGKTTTVSMVESILRHGGLTSSAVGNIGRPILETITDGVNYDCLVVELSSFQLHWVTAMSLHSAVVLNVEPDHLEWYEGASHESAFQTYAADKAKIYHNVSHSCLYDVTSEVIGKMVEDADVIEGARAIGFTNEIPAVSMMGVVDGSIVDRAFIPQRHNSALELIAIDDLPSQSPHMVSNALAAAGLARSFSVEARSVRDGLKNFELGPHRIQTLATSKGVTWVDDSKATNPHAASASLRGYESVVWIAGGQAKGTQFDDLVCEHASRLKAAILLGVDRDIVAQALRTHAPHVHVEVIDDTSPAAMIEAVDRARRLATDRDTVLLAPGCASLDMYASYSERGDWFARGVRSLVEGGHL